MLTFDANSLRENLKFCSKAKPAISFQFDDFETAKKVVGKLWPSALEQADKDVEDTAKSFKKLGLDTDNH